MKRFAFYNEKVEQSWLSSALAAISLGFLCGFYYWLLSLSFASILLAYFVSPWYLLALAALYSTALLPATVGWQRFIDLPIWQIWLDYFRFEIVLEDEEATSREPNQLLCEYPHGIYPLGSLLSFFCAKEVMQEGRKVFGLAASVIFRVPVMKHVFSWLGTRAATRRNLAHCLSQGSCGVVVGGIAEMYMGDEHQERIYLKRRTGFIRSALDNDVPVVPVYFLGNSQLFSAIGANEGGWLSAVSRRLRTSLIVFYGRFGLPIPRRSKIVMVIGKPIRFAKGTSVEQGHATFTAALEKLYADHRHLVPEFKDRPLVID
jgi:diacylglycerol O-acyltransferase 2, plant